MDFIGEIESQVGKKGNKVFMDIQPGDVAKTWADVKDLIRDYDYQPNTPVKSGIADFVKWYKEFYQINF